MPLVHGNDAFTYLDMALSTAYNVDAGAWIRVPMLGEAIINKREQFPKNREMGSLGAQSVVDFGRGTMEGSFKVYPRYNAVWFNQLLVQAFGGSEELGADLKNLDGTTIATGLRVHSYLPQSFKETAAGSASGVSMGLTLRVTKAGNTATGGVRERYTGCVIKRMTWEHPEGDRPFVTFDVIGQYSDTSAATTNAPAALATDEISVRARDLKNRYGIASGGGLCQASLAIPRQINVTGFKLVLESNIEFAPGFLNSPDVIEKPGHVDKWSVTGEVSSLLEQIGTFGPQGTPEAGWPAKDFLDKVASALRIRYASDTNVVGAIPYALEIYMKNLILTKAENGITEGGAPKITHGFEATAGTFTAAETALGANTKNTLLMATNGPRATAYTSGAEGGNIVDNPDV